MIIVVSVYASVPSVSAAYNPSHVPTTPCGRLWRKVTGDGKWTPPPINSALNPGGVCSYRAWNVFWSMRSPFSNGGTNRFGGSVTRDTDDIGRMAVPPQSANANSLL